MGPLTLFFMWAGIFCLALTLFSLLMAFGSDDFEGPILFFLIAGVCFIFIGFGTSIWDSIDDPRKGTVISKEFVPEHWSMCGKVPCHIDDEWFVTLHDGDNEGTIEVSQSEFNSVSRGDTFYSEELK